MVFMNDHKHQAATRSFKNRINVSYMLRFDYVLLITCFIFNQPSYV